MLTDALTNNTVKAAISALQNGDREAWSALFEPDATLYDDGQPHDLQEFTREALGHERFTSIDEVTNNGLQLVGQFHSDPSVHLRGQSVGGMVSRKSAQRKGIRADGTLHSSELRVKGLRYVRSRDALRVQRIERVGVQRHDVRRPLQLEA
jgi:hypothetical protein